MRSADGPATAVMRAHTEKTDRTWRHRLVDGAIRLVATFDRWFPHASAKRRRPHRTPRLFVEPSDFNFENAGDTARLSIGIEKLRERLPDAEISVPTAEINTFSTRFPGVVRVDAAGRALWLADGFVPHELRSLLRPDTLAWIRANRPGAIGRLWRYALHDDEEARVALDSYVYAMARADLLAVTGMSGLTDAYPEAAQGLLGSLSLALSGETELILFGQGIGPLENPALRDLAGQVLPKARLIAIRENGVSRQTLLSLGVDPARIVVTGDDAVAFAARARPAAPGQALGFNLRVSPSAETDRSDLMQFAAIVRARAIDLGCPVISVPISAVKGEEDARSFERGFAGFEGKILPRPASIEPEEVLAAVRQCRVVVTGSYLAGVFACANGIPAVCFARSRYYHGKFGGLADQFGDGCIVVDGTHDDWPTALDAAIREAWARAEDLRAGLLARADAQIDAAEAAYDKVTAIVAATKAR